MSDDEGSENTSSGDQSGADVVLPEHASAYFSPRSPPAVSSHRTIETEAVQLDPSVDPDLAQTRRMEPRPSEPPTWPDVDGPVANSPTVLVPVVRARRMRRRVLAGLVAALLGGTGGVVFGLLDAPPPPRGAATSGAPPGVTARAIAPGDPLAAEPPSPAVPDPTQKAEIQETGDPSPPITTATTPKIGVDAPAAASAAKATPPKTSAWIKSEPPHAWIR
jgi:hypothetical protein